MKTIVPVAVESRLTLIEQPENVKLLSSEFGRDVVVGGVKVRRTKLNSYADQTTPTDVFNNSLGFMTMTTEDWIALPPYKANRPWETRFEDKPHLCGKLETPLQTLCVALVKEDGTPICRLDGNGRVGAWLAGALEKPEFVHVITIVLPNEVEQTDYYVSKLFDTLNGDAQKISPEHKAAIAKLRLTLSGKWVEFESNLVKEINKTTFTGLGTVINKPKGKATDATASDWVFCNKETVFLVDSLGIDTELMTKRDLRCHTASVVHCMLRTLAGRSLNKAEGVNETVAKKAYVFWSKWGKEETGPVADLFNTIADDTDQSGAKGTKATKDLILDAFEKWRGDFSLPADFVLPSFNEWMEASKAKARIEMARIELQQKVEEADRIFNDPINRKPFTDRVAEIALMVDSVSHMGIMALLANDGFTEDQALVIFEQAGGVADGSYGVEEEQEEEEYEEDEQEEEELEEEEYEEDDTPEVEYTFTESQLDKVRELMGSGMSMPETVQALMTVYGIDEDEAESLYLTA